MPYVARTGGVVVGVFTWPQPGLAEELLADNNAEVLAYLASLVPGGTLQRDRARAEAKAIIDSSKDALGKVQRAAANVVRKRVNAIDSWLMDLKAAVAAATSLANLQARVALLPNMPQYSLQDIK